MIEVIYGSVSVIFTLFMAVRAKKNLYSYQHESSISKELEIFKINLEKIKKIDLSHNYKIGSDHLY
tara:strand:- start:600 stop:797 length:198 start_codon:yes stop_codon:yes gene_type:complete